VPRGEIEFKDIRFGYGRESGLIDGLSLTIHPGERIDRQFDPVGQALSVDCDRGRVVADLAAEIEGVERRRGDPAGPGGEQVANRPGALHRTCRHIGGGPRTENA
jgi:hypothetical protein